MQTNFQEHEEQALKLFRSNAEIFQREAINLLQEAKALQAEALSEEQQNAFKAKLLRLQQMVQIGENLNQVFIKLKKPS